MVDLNQSNIDPKDPKYGPLLAEIQGNIFQGNGRDRELHLFLTFNENKIPEAKQWIANFSQQHITSAIAQSELGQSGLFANFFLSMKGYRKLNFSYGETPNDLYFRAGMQDVNTQQNLGDPPVNECEKGYQQQLDSLILLAHNNKQELEAIGKQLRLELLKIATSIFQETGFVMRNSQNNVVEHFGFRDGISQPLFLKADLDRVKELEGVEKWNPEAPLKLVLFRDPLGKKEESYGSFLVYRKLEKNVPGWNTSVVELAKQLNISPDLAAAYAVGRFQDGTPVTQSQSATTGGDRAANNFNYQGDQQGSRCPFHAHARKTNPRGDTGTIPQTSIDLDEEKMHRIVRRGSSFGAKSPQEAQETGSGSLFLCFMADINNQFNFMQKVWSNSRDFIEREVGSDPVIGNNQPESENYKWPNPWGTTNEKQADFTHHVKMIGGEYFFAPSISFLNTIAD